MRCSLHPSRLAEIAEILATGLMRLRAPDQACPSTFESIGVPVSYARNASSTRKLWPMFWEPCFSRKAGTRITSPSTARRCGQAKTVAGVGRGCQGRRNWPPRRRALVSFVAQQRDDFVIVVLDRQLSNAFNERVRRFSVRIASRRPNPSSGDDPQLRSIAADIYERSSVARAVAGAFGVVNAVSLYVERGTETFDAMHVRAAERLA